MMGCKDLNVMEEYGPLKFVYAGVYSVIFLIIFLLLLLSLQFIGAI